MKARETKLQESRHTAPGASEPEGPLEADCGGVLYPATPDPVPEPWQPGFWDALVGYQSYIDPDRLRDFDAETRVRRSSDDEDFSSEHGYQPGFEGRSEFEHGEFERWL